MNSISTPEFYIVEKDHYTKSTKVFLDIIFMLYFLSMIFLTAYISSMFEMYTWEILIALTALNLILSNFIVNDIVEKRINIGKIKFEIDGIYKNEDLMSYETIECVEIYNYLGGHPKDFINHRNEILKIKISNIETVFVRRRSINSKKIKLEKYLVQIIDKNPQLKRIYKVYID